MKLTKYLHFLVFIALTLFMQNAYSASSCVPLTSTSCLIDQRSDSIEWKFIPTDPGNSNNNEIYVRPANDNGFCLSITNGEVQVCNCDDTISQKWKFNNNNLMSSVNNQCLDINLKLTSCQVNDNNLISWNSYYTVSELRVGEFTSKYLPSIYSSQFSLEIPSGFKFIIKDNNNKKTTYTTDTAIVNPIINIDSTILITNIGMANSPDSDESERLYVWEILLMTLLALIALILIIVIIRCFAVKRRQKKLNEFKEKMDEFSVSKRMKNLFHDNSNPTRHKKRLSRPEISYGSSAKALKPHEIDAELGTRTVAASPMTKVQNNDSQLYSGQDYLKWKNGKNFEEKIKETAAKDDSGDFDGFNIVIASGERSSSKRVSRGIRRSGSVIMGGFGYVNKSMYGNPLDFDPFDNIVEQNEDINNSGFDEYEYENIEYPSGNEDNNQIVNRINNDAITSTNSLRRSYTLPAGQEKSWSEKWA
ncbi:11293_t:CDS:2 [Diversispora eburnea]|uniref:11293_t:CDS:1 n=1 Tax=Diversispora eburnea TaxID=1213867 RepID=A0A9N9BQI7_9GLOM|nr:11293_t:CDS:2 [Diversispora eburnea]